jgi:hypothetical protein
MNWAIKLTLTDIRAGERDNLELQFNKLRLHEKIMAAQYDPVGKRFFFEHLFFKYLWGMFVNKLVRFLIILSFRSSFKHYSHFLKVMYEVFTCFPAYRKIFLLCLHKSHLQKLCGLLLYIFFFGGAFFSLSSFWYLYFFFVVLWRMLNQGVLENLTKK